MMTLRFLSLRLMALTATAAAAVASDTPSFRHDVLPILSKAGCNTGGCHGAIAGKGGFRLSLFGYDPEKDFFTITREVRGRRLDPADPARSLLLTKPTTAVPHKGGQRLEPGSEEYRILTQWISAGAPGPQPDDPAVTSLTVSPADSTLAPGEQRTLTVHARFSDGTTRDVTRQTKFTSTNEAVATVNDTGTMTGVAHGAGAITVWYSSQLATARVVSPFPHALDDRVFTEAPRAGFIDDLVLTQLRNLRLRPSPAADDTTFVRRAFLDTIGRLPTPAEARSFATDPAPDKHSRLADSLLARPEFIDYWSYKWADILLVTSSKLRPEPLRAYADWIRAQVTANRPWNEVVTDLVTAKGSSVENGATNFFAVHQDPETMAENVSQAFLSLSINCAKCHNHPLEKWTNDQYYAFANLFSRVRAKGWGGDPRSGDGKRTLYLEPRGDLIQPRTGRPQPPAPLDAPPLDPEATDDRREALARWLTAPDNPYFARAIANRLWANFLGTGVVEPVDDLRVSNPPSNEPLLDALAGFLTTRQFDLKSLMREILVSHTYRRSSEALPENRDDTRHYARFQPRRLSAEVLSDAITDVTQVGDAFSELVLSDGSSEATQAYTQGTRALQLNDSAVKNYFLKTFGRNARDITCECERSNQPSLIQVLHLANGSTINDKLAAPDSRLSSLLERPLTPEETVDELWWLALSRPAREPERSEAAAVLAAATPDDRRAATEDLLWSLLTSREFLFQH